MAMVTCRECGKEISDMAGTCPHCGYPIQAVKNAQIEQNNRAFYKKQNKMRILYSIFGFLFTFAIGVIVFKKDVQVWGWITYFASLAIFLWLCFSKFPYIIGLFYSITHRKYKQIPFIIVCIAIIAGYVFGGCIGMGMHK